MDIIIIEGTRKWRTAPYRMARTKDGQWHPEHRLIMEAILGRPLTENEVVHHRDGNKQNNALENLCVMSKTEHSRLHGQQIKQGERPRECWFCQKITRYGVICPSCRREYGLDKPFGEWPEWAKQYVRDRNRERKSAQRFAAHTVSLDLILESGGDVAEGAVVLLPDGWNEREP